MVTFSSELVGNDLNFKKSLDFAKNIAVTKSPVLIMGEIGTGKRHLAYYIHTNSARKSGPFIIVDCAADLSIVEQEVLGYREESGKFHKGALERGSGGTVVFANIESLEENFQKRLYKIIQELPDYELDVRLIASTSKNLSKMVTAGKFLRNLFTFFSCSQITLDLLKERNSDIELLAQYFANSKAEGGQVSFTQEALEKLNSLEWTRNIAELKDMVEEACSKMENNTIDAECLELSEKSIDIKLDGDEEGFKLMSLREAEKLLIKKALIYTAENRTQAAKILGVSIRTLRNKINEYRQDGTQFFVNLR